ncbi:hypothetical protein DPEC_G00369980 [Dallia pectoralis]|nr:hypothetical protein DPEC_G00369980 [Dallia pectoralis]
MCSAHLCNDDGTDWVSPAVHSRNVLFLGFTKTTVVVITMRIVYLLKSFSGSSSGKTNHNNIGSPGWSHCLETLADARSPTLLSFTVPPLVPGDSVAQLKAKQ